jgi:hypothetical protein
VILDSVLDSLAANTILSRGQRVAGSIDAPAVPYLFPSARMADTPIPTDPMLAQDRPENNKTGGALAGLAVAAVAAGLWGYGARIRSFRNRCVVVRRSRSRCTAAAKATAPRSRVGLVWAVRILGNLTSVR